ncbi:MAG: glycosyltransferase family 4 protein [Bacteroidales bacterium]
MKKILYIVPHRYNRSPGQRFRCEHFIPILQKNGFSITYSNLLSAWDDKMFYKKGKYAAKLYILLKSFVVRFYDFLRAWNYDYIFIYREAIMVGTVFFERLFSFTNAKILYDFDDSIWLNDTSEGNRNLRWLKNPAKTGTIVAIANTVIVGNNYLAQYARKFNHKVIVIPTTIDTEYHKRTTIKHHTDTVCIGWTGTSTTLKHFEEIIPVLMILKQKYCDKIYIKHINNIHYEHKELQIKSILWSFNNEISELEEFDIGIMPLPNDEWTKGKCGFKGLQYMSLEIPPVMSGVGVNTEIIQHGENGYIANTTDEWIVCLSLLIEDALLRQKIGKAARKTIEERYSIKSQQEKYLKLFD